MVSEVPCEESRILDKLHMQYIKWHYCSVMGKTGPLFCSSKLTNFCVFFLEPVKQGSGTTLQRDHKLRLSTTAELIHGAADTMSAISAGITVHRLGCTLCHLDFTKVLPHKISNILFCLVDSRWVLLYIV